MEKEKPNKYFPKTPNAMLLKEEETPLSEKVFVQPERAGRRVILERNVKEAVERLTPGLFHDIYEEVAMRVGWETNKKCKVKFDDLPETNQETMITTIRLIKDKIFGEFK